MKKLAVFTLLAASVAFNIANATSMGFQYYTVTTPAKSSYTITLSGECFGKITKTITGLNYRREYQHTGGAIERAESGFNIFTDDGSVYTSVQAEAYTPEDKHNETLAKGKLTFNAIFKSDITTGFKNLSGGSYDNQIICKSGEPLSSYLLGWDLVINKYASSFKGLGSLVHTHSTDDIGTGTYKIKFSSSGVIGLPGVCAVKGDLLGADYKVTCGQPKSIKVKVAVSAEGESTLQY